jgi:hypothetical protein
MVRKLFSSTFGNIFYDTQNMGPGVLIPTSEIVSRAGTMIVNKHDDRFYESSNGVIENASGVFMTYDTHDLRDLLDEGMCLADVGVGIQRLRETPEPNAIYNMPPAGSNIIETIIITNSKIDTQYGALNGSLPSLYLAGFQPINVGSVGNLAYRNENKLDDQREIIYCERRVYGQDNSQIGLSPNQMGGMGGSSPTEPPTRWCNNLLLLDRTVCGEADIVVGPEITIIRLIQIKGRDRGVQNQHSTPGLPALELTHNDMRIALSFPPIRINIIGDHRKMTETEKAIEYTNVLLSNQNLIPN